MAKTPSKKLYRLIKSLTGSEKRYFKIFIKNFGERDSKYGLLFDAIDQSNGFDDTALQQMVYGENIVESKKYSELKSYLYSLIIKSLQFYDEKSSVDYKLKGMLLNVRTLYKRGHYQECLILIEKIKKIAKDMEDFSVLVEALRWEKTVAHSKTDISFLDRELPRIEREQKRYLEQLQNIEEYRNLALKILVQLRKDASRRKEQRENIKAIMRHPLLQEKSLASSVKSKVLYYRIYSIYYFSIADYNLFYEYSKKLIDFFDTQPKLLREDKSEYISAFSNYLQSCGWLKKYDELDKGLKKFKVLKPNTFEDEQKIYRQYFLNQLSFCIVKGDFTKGVEEMEQHFIIAQKFDQNLFRNNTFYFQFFYNYFGIGDYENALKYLNEWLVGVRKNEREDLQSLARILDLIIHYEMGSMDLVRTLTRRLLRKLKSSKHSTQYEKEIVGLFRYLTEKPRSKRERKLAFEQARTTLNELKKRRDEAPIMELFNISDWLTGKITNKTFGKVVHYNFRQANDRKNF